MPGFDFGDIDLETLQLVEELEKEDLNQVNENQIVMPIDEQIPQKYEEFPKVESNIDQIFGQSIAQMSTHDELNVKPMVSTTDSLLRQIHQSCKSPSKYFKPRQVVSRKKIDMRAQRYIIEDDEDREVDIETVTKEDNPVIVAADAKGLLEQFEINENKKISDRHLNRTKTKDEKSRKRVTDKIKKHKRRSHSDRRENIKETSKIDDKKSCPKSSSDVSHISRTNNSEDQKKVEKQSKFIEFVTEIFHALNPRAVFSNLFVSSCPT